MKFSLPILAVLVAVTAATPFADPFPAEDGTMEVAAKCKKMGGAYMRLHRFEPELIC